MSLPEIETYWTSAEARIDNELLPLAIKVKCFPKGATASDLGKHFLARTRDGDGRLTGPKRKIADGLRALSLLCKTGQYYLLYQVTAYAELENVPIPDHRAADMRMIEESFLRSHSELYALFEQYSMLIEGYLVAMNDISQQNVDRGAAGRRELGEQTMNKVKEAAQKFMHLPKDAAASLISEEIGKSASTVRRLLSEQFPGAAWRRQIR
ncbi:hypothetical protein ABIC94_003760 [Variovorax paradoxus]|uniref:hypothetical protein n=1 Tax=Variovorax paradoxus TaxID=34073 RepID=UPI00339655F2